MNITYWVVIICKYVDNLFLYVCNTSYVNTAVLAGNFKGFEY